MFTNVFVFFPIFWEKKIWMSLLHTATCNIWVNWYFSTHFWLLTSNLSKWAFLQFMVLTSYFDLLTSQAIDIFVWPLNRSKNNMSTAREVKRWLVGCHEDIFFFFWRFQRNGWFWCNLCPSWRNLNMPKGYSPSFGNFWASMYLKQYWRRKTILCINTKHCII